MPDSNALKIISGEKTALGKDDLISQISSEFSEIAIIEAVADKITSIDAMIARIDEDLLVSIHDLMYDDAFLQALEQRLSELIDGYEEPAELIRQAKEVLAQARDILSTAKGKHAELLSAIQQSTLED